MQAFDQVDLEALVAAADAHVEAPKVREIPSHFEDYCDIPPMLSNVVGYRHRQKERFEKAIAAGHPLSEEQGAYFSFLCRWVEWYENKLANQRQASSS